MWSDDALLAELPPSVDPNVPSIARVYDYWLGGAHNFQSDRDFAENALAAVPRLRDIAVANRQFLMRAIRMLAGQGITQFLDIGCGLPATSSVHELAQAINPDVTTVYVDNDPVAVAHGELILAKQQTHATIFQQDFLAPEHILDHPDTQALIASGAPTALIVAAVLHFVTDDQDPAGVLSTLLEPFPAGSYLVYSHGTADSDPEMDTLGGMYAERSTSNGVSRSHATQAALLGRIPRLELIEPGLVWTPTWRPASEDKPRLYDTPEQSSCYGAVGVVR